MLRKYYHRNIGFTSAAPIMKNKNIKENLKGKGQRDHYSKKWMLKSRISEPSVTKIPLVLRTLNLFPDLLLFTFQGIASCRDSCSSFRSVYSLLEPTNQLFLQAEH